MEKGVVDSRKKDTGKKGMKMSRMMSAELLPKWRERYERRGRQGRSRMLDEVCEQFGYSRNWPFGAALAFVLLALVLAATYAHRLRFREAK